MSALCRIYMIHTFRMRLPLLSLDSKALDCRKTTILLQRTELGKMINPPALKIKYLESNGYD